MAKSDSRKYAVNVCYNLECTDAAKAIDKVLASSPMIPIEIHAEPICEYEDDDDD